MTDRLFQWPSLKIQHLVAALLSTPLRRNDFLLLWDGFLSLHYCWTLIESDGAKRKFSLFDWCQKHLSLICELAEGFHAIRPHLNSSGKREKHTTKQQNGSRCARFTAYQWFIKTTKVWGAYLPWNAKYALTPPSSDSYSRAHANAQTWSDLHLEFIEASFSSAEIEIDSEFFPLWASTVTGRQVAVQITPVFSSAPYPCQTRHPSDDLLRCKWARPFTPDLLKPSIQSRAFCPAGCRVL